MIDRTPEREERGDPLPRNALIAFAAICLAGVLLVATVPEVRAGMLVAYEQMYQAMVTMAVMCGFVPGPS